MPGSTASLQLYLIVAGGISEFHLYFSSDTTSECVLFKLLLRMPWKGRPPCHIFYSYPRLLTGFLDPASLLAGLLTGRIRTTHHSRRRSRWRWSSRSRDSHILRHGAAKLHAGAGSPDVDQRHVAVSRRHISVYPSNSKETGALPPSNFFFHFSHSHSLYNLLHRPAHAVDAVGCTLTVKTCAGRQAAAPGTRMYVWNVHIENR